MFNFIAGIVVGVLGTAIWIGYKECQKAAITSDMGTL